MGGPGPGDHDALQDAQFAGQALAAFLQPRALAEAVAQGAPATDEILIGAHGLGAAVDLRVDLIQFFLVADDIGQFPADGFHGVIRFHKRAFAVRPWIVDAAAFLRAMGADVPTAEVMGDAGFEGIAEYFRRDVAGDRGRTCEQ